MNQMMTEEAIAEEVLQYWKARKLASLIQQTCRTIDSKDKRMETHRWKYQTVPASLIIRRNKLVDFRSNLVERLMRTLLANDFYPGEKLFNMWVKL